MKCLLLIFNIISILNICICFFCILRNKKIINELQSDLERVSEWNSRNIDECIKYKNENESLKNEIKNLKEELEFVQKDFDYHLSLIDKFESQIVDLQKELETYRPMRLRGNGQCSCYNCEKTKGFNRHWTNTCSKYKGHVYCDICLNELLEKEKKSSF